ncbi:MAG TPA: nickel-dependent hydrogenase large subunit [Micropepsaceae bacterium]|nr:nickel-dependent hydrogenase large subunit [Micropepsaceae bacterium]
MAALNDILANGRIVAAHRPWPRAIVDAATWQAAIMHLHQGSWTLSGLWGEPDCVHMAVCESETNQFAVLSVESPNGRFPSVGQAHPPAIRLERAITDLFGLIPEGANDTRPWLDHGRWGVRAPLGANQPGPGAAGYEFLPAEGESLHQIAVGPVHAGIIEPGHFRFTANGEAVVRLEERLGYVHKGIESLMAGADLERAAKLAGRVSGDSTVAYALAFARAVEAAAQIEAPPRAHYVRALLAELERLANHFGDVGAICNDASFSMLQAHCAVLREHVLRTADACFSHRLMRDCIVPAGVATDLQPEGIAAIRALIDKVRQTFPALVRLYENTASLQDRTVTSGILKPALAQQFGAGGYVGRASGRAFDARRALPYPPYDKLRFDVPVLAEGDVNARVWIRIREVDQSLLLIEQILAQLPDGPVRIDIPARSGEGVAMVEGFRGDILVWLRLDETGRVTHCHLRDPSWFHWPLLEAAIEGNIVADFPLCNKSFNCSYSGHDL